MVRILIVDDHAIVREGVRQLIQTRPAWTVCGEAADGRTAMDLAQRLSPDLAIVDMSLPDMGGLGLARLMKQTCPDVRTLLFTFIDDEDIAASALAAGASGYVLKSETSEVLEVALSTVAAGGVYVSPALVAKGVTAKTDRKTSPMESFTPRELEVIQLVAEGKSNKQIAHTLEISPKTVEVHRASAMRRADLRSTVEVVRFAIKHYLIPS